MESTTRNYIYVCLAMLCLALLSSCYNSSNEIDNFEISVDNNEQIDYRYSFETFFKQKDDCSTEIQYIVHNDGADLETGLYVFVNGIPQKYKKGDQEDYVFVETINEEKKEFNYSLIPEYPYEKNDASTVRFVSMLFPDIVITNEKNYFIGHKHSCIQLLPQTIEIPKNGNGFITKCEAFGEEETNSSRIISEFFDGKEITNTVLERKDIEEYEVEFCYETGEYILSFWGDNKPIKIGDSDFYEIHLEKGKKSKYKFEINDDYFDKIDNFFFVLCPKNSGNMSAIFGNLHVFTDDKNINPDNDRNTYIHEDTMVESESSPFENNDIDNSENIFDENSFRPQVVSDETVLGIKDGHDIYRVSKDGRRILGKYSPLDDEMINLNSSIFSEKNNVVELINYELNEKEYVILDNKLDVIIQGKLGDLFFTDNVIDIVGLVDDYIYYTDYTYKVLYEKNLITKEEKKIFDILDEEYTVNDKVWKDNNNVVFEGMNIITNEYVVGVYTINNKSFDWYNNRRIQDSTASTGRSLLYYPVEIYEPAVVTVEVLKPNEKDIISVTLNDSEEASPLYMKLSDDGDYIITKHTINDKQEIVAYKLNNERIVIGQFSQDVLYYFMKSKTIEIYPEGNIKKLYTYGV